MAKKEINIFENYLVPKHEIMTEEEKQQLLKKFNISLKQLPRIKERDPAVKAIGAKKGDIIKIERKEGDKVIVYYRVVI